MNKDIFLTNNLSNKKEKFVPLNEKKVGMYVCGPTVYDNPHIGNARPLVVFDVLFKDKRIGKIMLQIEKLEIIKECASVGIQITKKRSHEKL